MSKKRGLSLEEKRKCLLEIFHDTMDVFQLKDLEKMAPKKGVVQQSVKEVIQSLIDDDMVHQEKIGSSNFLWSFPSEAAVKLENDLEKLEKQMQENSKARANLEQELQESQRGKEDSLVQDQRKAKMEQKRALEAELQKQQNLMAGYVDNDPERYQHINNIEVLKSWMKKRFEGQEEQLDAFFSENGYKDDMDYLQ